MIHNGIAVPTPTDIDGQEQLTTVLEAVIETAENVVSHERQQRNDHDLDEQADLSPLFALEDDGEFTLEALETALSSVTIEGHWQHDGWQPGDSCPDCGGTKFSVIEPREYVYTYDDEGVVVDSTYGDVSGPAMNHLCRECGMCLTQHPATAVFWIE